MAEIRVHPLENSKSQRILWLLEELELPYAVVRYQRMMGAAPPEMTKVHPLGKAPSVEIDGLVMAESAAIIQYLLMRFGEGRLAPPADSPDYAKFLELLHYPESSLALRTLLPLFVRLFGVESPMLAGYAAHGLSVQLDYLDAMLADRAYLIGGAFIGARAEVAEGVIVGEGAVLSMGVYLGASTKIVDRATGEVFVGRVPDYAVVVPGSLPGKPLPDGTPGPSLYCAVIVKRVDAQTRAKTGINELLRD